MTIPRLAAMSRYWKQHPPMHVLLAAYVGYEPPAEAGATAARTPPSAVDLEALMAAYPQVKR